MTELTSTQSLAERVASASWYQSLRLPGGIVTPGQFDTLAELARVPFPASLEGKRCLDVGTADGFWAFEMERRGAAEVVAVDVGNPARWDWPGNTDRERRIEYDHERAPLDGFDIAREALGSSVQRRDLTVYELAPEVVGEFDFAFMGSLLLHLRDPVAALASIGGVLRGELLSVDALSPPLTLLHPVQPLARLEANGWPLWWAMNLRAYRRVFDAAGLEILGCGRPFFVKQGPAYRASPENERSSYRRLRQAAISKLGILHAWVRIRPSGLGVSRMRS
jgi:tRNA (mo5U34)-methyltransferase